MNLSYEPHRLVIQHLSVLESAPAIVSEVEKRVFAAIDKKIKEWVESQDDWEGVYVYLDDETDETVFKPVGWEKDDNGAYDAWYAIGAEDDKGFNHRLSTLLGSVTVRYGLWFGADAAWVTSLSDKGARPSAAWKNYLSEKFPQTKLAESGFELQGDSLFLPIRVDSQLIADSYPDSLDDALTPIDDALKILETAHPEIDALLRAAQEYFIAR